MKKIKILITSLLLLNVIFVGVIVYAASTSYTSYLKISPGSSHIGTARDYKYSYQKIDIAVSEFYESDLPHKVVVMVGTKKTSGFSQKAYTTINLIKNTCVYYKFSTKIGTSNVQYAFGTYSHAGTGEGGTGSYYAGFYAPTITMTSSSS